MCYKPTQWCSISCYVLAHHKRSSRLRYLFLLVAVALISPLLLKLYTMFAPGEMIGSIDGWLGFLGGYFGGILSFLAAITVFKNQRRDSLRPYIKSAPEAKNSKATQCLYSLKNTDVTFNPETFKTSDSNRDERFIDFAIKNIGIGPALDIVIFNKKGRKLALADSQTNIFQEFKSLTDLEVGESISWIVCLDLNESTEGGTYTEEWKLHYKDILGNIYKEKLHVFFNTEPAKAGISIKT